MPRPKSENSVNSLAQKQTMKSFSERAVDEGDGDKASGNRDQLIQSSTGGGGID